MVRTVGGSQMRAEDPGSWWDDRLNPDGDDYEYYRVAGCRCPEPFLCQGKCLNDNEGDASGASGSDALH